ncbi:hypothetical protein ACQ4PT_068929 [Festuca glaucescens]
MEALAYNSLADRFNEMLHAGLTYDFIGVIFYPIEMYSEHFWYIDSEFIMSLKPRTEVRTLGRRIDSSLCPPRFPQFNTIFMRRDKSITDVVGVLAYVGEIQYKYNMPYYRGIPVRDIGLMNFQGQLIFLHVYSQHLYRNIGRWAPAQREFQTLVMTNVQIDRILGSLSTMDESTFIFSPRTNLEDHHFEGIRAAKLARPDDMRTHYLLPLAVMDAYALLVVNKQRRRTFLMDPCYYPNRQEARIQRSEVMKESKALMEEFNEVLHTMNLGWDTQVAEWPMDSYQVMGTNRNSDDSEFTVLEHMATADGTDRIARRIPNDPLELRKQLMVHLLKFGSNEAFDNIPLAIKLSLGFIRA